MDAIKDDTPAVFRQQWLSYSLAAFVPALLWAASIVVFMRIYGAAEYGRFSVLQGIALTTAAYASGWLSQGVLRFSSSWRQSEEVRTMRMLACVSAVAAGLAGAGFALATATHDVLVLLVVLTLAPCIVLYQVSSAHAQAALLHRAVARAEIARAALVLASAALLVLFLPRVAGTLLFAMLIAYVASALLLPRILHGPVALQPATARALWTYGWPMALWLGSSQLLGFSDRFMIAHFDGYDMAGQYAAVSDLVRRGFLLALAPVTLSVHPLLVNLWSANERHAARTLLARSIRTQIAIGGAAVLGLLLFGPWLLGSFVAAGDVNLLLPLGLGSACWALALLAHKPLEIAQHTRRMLWWMGIALILNVALNAILIPPYGYRAAAWVSFASALAYLLLVTLDGRRRLDDHTDPLTVSVPPAP